MLVPVLFCSISVGASEAHRTDDFTVPLPPEIYLNRISKVPHCFFLFGEPQAAGIQVNSIELVAKKKTICPEEKSRNSLSELGPARYDFG